MKNIILLGVWLMVLAIIPPTVYAQEGNVVSSNVSVYEQNTSMGVSAVKVTPQYEIVAGFNNNDGTPVIYINDQERGIEYFTNPNDSNNLSNSPYDISIDGNIASFAGAVNIGDGSDVQSRVTVVDLVTETVLHEYTFRSGGSLIDHILDATGQYVYILMEDIHSNTNLETSYSGIPSNGSGVDLSGSGTALIRIDLTDDSITEYYWFANTHVLRESLMLAPNGKLYCMVADNGEEFRIVEFDSSSLTALRSFFINFNEPLTSFGTYNYDSPIGYAVVNNKEYLAISNRGFPMILNLTDGLTYNSKLQNLAVDFASGVTGDSDIESIKLIPGTDTFLYTRRDTESTFGSSWFLFTRVNGERYLYFRERLTIAGTSDISRVHVMSSYFDGDTLKYIARTVNTGAVSMGEVEITDGNQEGNVLYRAELGSLSTLNEDLIDSGIESYDFSGNGSFTIEPGNKVIFSGLPNTSDVTVTRITESGYSVLPESSTNEDYSNDRVVYSVAADLVGSNPPIKEADVLKIYSETAPAALGTNEFDKQKFYVYPNPTSGTLNLSEALKGADVYVYDSLGRTIESHNNLQVPIELSRYASGTYFVRFQLKNGNKGSITVIKQ
jgi:hypothetical protein